MKLEVGKEPDLKYKYSSIKFIRVSKGQRSKDILIQRERYFPVAVFNKATLYDYFPNTPTKEYLCGISKNIFHPSLTRFLDLT